MKKLTSAQKKLGLRILLFLLNLIAALITLSIAIVAPKEIKVSTTMCEITNVEEKFFILEDTHPFITEYYHEIYVTAVPVCEDNCKKSTFLVYSDQYNQLERAQNYSKLAYDYYTFIDKNPCEIKSYRGNSAIETFDEVDVSDGDQIEGRVVIIVMTCSTLSVTFLVLSVMSLGFIIIYRNEKTTEQIIQETPLVETSNKIEEVN